MRPFEFVRATAISEALDWLGKPNVKLLAGGTTLVDLMKLGVEAPETLVDIGRLALSDISVEGGSLNIGALASNSDAASHPEVLRHFPVVAQALLSGASGQIRNAATMGGNLLQRTRCSYFRGTDWRCNKRLPGSGCAAIDGLNASHAVLGVSAACIAVNPSDLAVALLAVDARVHLASRGAERCVAIGDFYRLPGTTPDIETVMAADELITRIEIPLPAQPEASRYLKLRGRASYEFATASVAASVTREGSTVTQIAVALGGVGTVPWRSRAAERQLQGHTLSAVAIDAFCDELLSGATVTSANAHKLAMARGAIGRCLELAVSC